MQLSYFAIKSLVGISHNINENFSLGSSVLPVKTRLLKTPAMESYFSVKLQVYKKHSITGASIKFWKIFGKFAHEKKFLLMNKNKYTNKEHVS